MEVSNSNEKGDIIQSKKIIIRCRPGIFPGTKTSKKGDTHHVGYHFMFLERMRGPGKDENSKQK